MCLFFLILKEWTHREFLNIILSKKDPKNSSLIVWRWHCMVTTIASTFCLSPIDDVLTFSFLNSKHVLNEKCQKLHNNSDESKNSFNLYYIFVNCVKRKSLFTWNWMREWVALKRYKFDLVLCDWSVNCGSRGFRLHFNTHFMLLIAQMPRLSIEHEPHAMKLWKWIIFQLNTHPLKNVKFVVMKRF